MALYRYIATTAGDGATRKGELSADSAHQVRLALRRMNLLPLRVFESPVQKVGRATLAAPIRNRLLRNRRRSALIELYESLAALLTSGTALAPALDLLASATSRTGSLSRSLSERVKGGASLSAAMGDHEEWFAPVDMALVQSAEESGQTESALTDLAEHHSRADELGAKLAGALAYPALLFVFGLGVVIFLTTTTLPQLAGVIEDSGASLPRSTTALLFVGHLLTARWPLTALSLALVVTVVVWFVRAERFAGVRLKIPLAGAVTLKGQTADASLLLARLLNGGVPLTNALSLVAPTAPNAVLRRALDDLRQELKDGGSVAASLSSTGLFDPVFCRVLEIGEASGELAEALASIGRRQRTQARRVVDRLAAALEPATILLLAAMIGFVVYAAITPMLRLTQTL